MIKEQMGLFGEGEKVKGIIIPKTIVSPLESNEKEDSNEYRLEFFKYTQFIKAIQSYYKCTFLEARYLFFKHRKNQEPIKVDESYFF